MSDPFDTESLRDSAGRVLNDLVSIRRAYDHDSRPDIYPRLVELGWTALSAPESAGGLGQNFDALRPLYEEMGRAVAPVSFAGGMALLEEAVDPSIAAGIVAGEVRVAIASGSEANGNVTNVLDGIQATHLLVLSDEAGDALLFDLADAERRPVEMWDRSRVCVDITLRAPPPVRLPSAAIRAHLDLAIACDSIGGAVRALEEALTYMRTREQFGRPIGSFQALKHRAANLKAELELAAALNRSACEIFASRSNDWEAMAAAAKHAATAAYREIAEESVQFHGGVGFTWEYDCHIFLKRAWLNEMLGGPPVGCLERIAAATMARA